VLIVGADEVEHDRLTLRLGAEQHAGWSEVVLDEVRARCRAPDFGA
jgi:hypothetical protein